MKAKRSTKKAVSKGDKKMPLAPKRQKQPDAKIKKLEAAAKELADKHAPEVAWIYFENGAAYYLEKHWPKMFSLFVSIGGKRIVRHSLKVRAKALGGAWGKYETESDTKATQAALGLLAIASKYESLSEKLDLPKEIAAKIERSGYEKIGRRFVAAIGKETVLMLRAKDKTRAEGQGEKIVAIMNRAIRWVIHHNFSSDRKPKELLALEVVEDFILENHRLPTKPEWLERMKQADEKFTGRNQWRYLDLLAKLSIELPKA